MSELDNGYINSNFELENEEKESQTRTNQISQSQISTPIKLVEVKAPQMTAEISFPKPVTFSEPVTGTKNEEIFDRKNSALFSEDNEESYFINKRGVKDFSVLDEHADRWAAYRTESEPKKRNWIPVVIGVALAVGLVAGFGTMFGSLWFGEKEQSTVSTVTQEVPETIEEVKSTEPVEVAVVEGSSESVEPENAESMESTKGSSFTREPLVMEQKPAVKTFTEDTENIGYNVTYDAERAEQMLDALEELYEQMPERKE